MAATQDPALLDQTFSYIQTKSRDQDVMYFFRALQSNVLARRRLAMFFQENYNSLMERFGENFTIQSLISISFGTLSTKKDLEGVKEFFKGKDTSKYHMSLGQTLETIRTRIAYIEVYAPAWSFGVDWIFSSSGLLMI